MKRTLGGALMLGAVGVLPRALFAEPGPSLTPGLAPTAAPAPTPEARPEPRAERRPELVRVDRAVVRFAAPETGGQRTPRFVFERELSFEARLEALSDPDRGALGDAPYADRHVTAALDRHIAETILGTLRIEPEPTALELEHQSALAHRLLSDRAGGEDALDGARRAEGISEREFGRLLQQKARASLYLDRMVTPMLQPSEAELRSLHKSTNTPFSNAPFDVIRPALLRWYVSRRLNAALSSFFENARSRIEIRVL